jgi:hypothetical protein
MPAQTSPSILPATHAMQIKGAENGRISISVPLKALKTSRFYGFSGNPSPNDERWQKKYI